MVNTKITNYLLDAIAESEDLFTSAGLKKIFKEMLNIEKYENEIHENQFCVRKRISKTYCGTKKIYLCSAPGCNVPTYNGSRFCECHKHNYKHNSAPMIKKMFPNQRTIPMVGIYGAFWQWLHEYMNKRNTKIGVEAARQEHRMNRIIQFIAASTILTVDDIECYLMTKPNFSKNSANRSSFEKGETYHPSAVIDDILKTEADITKLLIK